MAEEREIELHAIDQVMRTENGRDFMWRCLTECGTFDDIFSPDQIVSAHRSGQRRIGLWLVSELKEANSDLYMQMLKEHIDE